MTAEGLRSAPATSARRVLFLLPPGVHLLDLGGPAQVFYTAARLGAPYTLEFCAASPEVKSAQGLTFSGLTTFPEILPNDLVMVPGFAPETPPLELDSLWHSGALVWLRDGLEAGIPVASVCSGAFILGEAGLLDGRRCTTHWNHTAVLQKRYPAAKVLETALFAHDGGVTTSAGIASGIDMALSLIERDRGPLFTARVARELVVYLRRSGTQSQSSIYLEYRTHLHPGVHRVQDWLIEHATEKVTLADLAAVANLSTRSLSRAFKDATGLTPLQYQQRLRLEHAATLMHNPKLTLDEVARRCGFEDARHFRRLWQAQFGASPSASRPARRTRLLETEA